jgi:hypothetical protein
MRDALALAPPNVREKVLVAGRVRLLPAALAIAVLGVAVALVLPRGLEAQHLLSIEDDPAAIAERTLDQTFNADVAGREIEQALAANDADLAQSFVDLAAARQVALDPALTDKVKVAVADENSAGHAAQSFAMGLVTGEPTDMSGFAGTALGDLFVFGDIRDAVREGAHYASGQEVDELVLGLAAVGLAITAGTYASGGVAAPARVGLSLAKVARKTGKLSGELTTYIARVLRGVVDWSALRRAAGSFSLSEPAVAVRAAREAVKVEKASELVRLAGNVGRVQAKAGTKAALDGLKVAETPREMGRVAKLAEKEGSKTRAILKVAGRGAIALTVAAFDLGVWILGALLTLFGLVSSLKSATERMTLRHLRRRKARRERFAAFTARG